MNATNIGVWCTVAGMLIAVVSTRLTIRSASRTREDADQSARDRLRAQAEADGAARLQPQIELLLSQLADARRDRDAAQKRSDEYEGRYLNIRDRGNHEPH